MALGKLGMWFAFAVLFAVLPTLGEFLSTRQKNGPHKFDFFELAARADLYVVAMGLAASALAQTLMRTKNSVTPPVLKFCGAVNILILALTALLAATSNGSDMNSKTVGQQSLILLITTLLSCGSSTYICELENSEE
ncbi:hypothetical protein [Streptomyces cylindrosporus]|uniref:Uncharacterized protein n=1 Tax=Streptomyces cylindrosporus TaxID=2927583 RepID=A0ABS9YKB5_9ACTN|nr:hypothetical protein [Streptomyces cylindrosporus]MCI3276286.1 hypothetical protein [Streptomyces cylindrosporus]